MKKYYLNFIYCFFYLPILLVIINSFNSARRSSIWQGFSTQWYHELFQNSSIWHAAFNSIFLGILTASIASIIGTLAAISFYRYQFLGKKLLHAFIFMLILIPDLILGVSLLILFSSIKLKLGFTTLLLSHITFCIPFAIMSVYTRLNNFDAKLIEAAKDLGANEWIILTRIFIPSLWPAILVAWLISFTLSLDDIMISYFVSGPSFEILPLKIFSMARLGVQPELNALSTLLFMFTLLLIALFHWGKSKK